MSFLRAIAGFASGLVVATFLLSGCNQVTKESRLDASSNDESNQSSPSSNLTTALNEFSRLEQKLSSKGFEWQSIPSSPNAKFSEVEAERLVPAVWRETRAFSREERRSLEETLVLLDSLRARAYHISVQNDGLSADERQVFRNRAFISSYYHEWVRLRLGLDKAFQLEERLVDDSDISLVNSKGIWKIKFGEDAELPQRWFVPCHVNVSSEESAAPFYSKCEFAETSIVKHLATIYQYETTQLRRVSLGMSPFLMEMEARASGWSGFSHFLEVLKNPEFQKYANSLYEAEHLHGARIQVPEYEGDAPWSGRNFGTLMTQAVRSRLGEGPRRRFSEDSNVAALATSLSFIQKFPKNPVLLLGQHDLPDLFATALERQAVRAKALESWLDLKELECELTLLSRSMRKDGEQFDWGDLVAFQRFDPKGLELLSFANFKEIAEGESCADDKAESFRFCRFAVLMTEYRRQSEAFYAMATKEKWIKSENFINLTALVPFP